MSTTQVRIGPADDGRTLTLDEFRDAEEEPGYRYELARGVLEVTIVPNDPHGQIVYNLIRALVFYQREHPGLIRRIGGAGEFRLWVPEMVSGRNPDVAIVFRGTPKDDEGHRPPSFVAEVVSKGGEDRDYQTKREEYLVFGIREYWIIDPARGQVTVLTRADGPAWTERVFRGGVGIVSPLLPGLAATVAALWVDVEDDAPEANGAGGHQP